MSMMMWGRNNHICGVSLENGLVRREREIARPTKGGWGSVGQV